MRFGSACQGQLVPQRARVIPVSGLCRAAATLHYVRQQLAT